MRLALGLYLGRRELGLGFGAFLLLQTGDYILLQDGVSKLILQ